MAANLTVGWMNSVINPPTNYNERTELTPEQYYAGKVSTAFFNTRKMVDRSTIIQGQNTGQLRYPIMARPPAAVYHVPGTRLVGQAMINKNHRSVNFDDRLVAHQFIDENDLAMAQVAWVDNIASMLGQNIANAEDINASIVSVLAARSASNVAGIPGGSVITAIEADTNGYSLEAAIFAAKEVLDSKAVPEDGRSLVVRSSAYNQFMVQLGGRYFNRDLGQTVGSYSMPMVHMVAGFEFFYSNNLPNSNIASTPAGANNPYLGNFTKTVGVAWRKEAFMTGYLVPVSEKPTNPDSTDVAAAKALSVLKLPIPDAMGTLMAAKLTVGMAVLRPDQAVEIVLP